MGKRTSASRRRREAAADSMDTDALTTTSATGLLKPRVVKTKISKAAQKLTRKQKLRKAKKQERGAANADRREIKAEHDAHKAERRLRAKALW
mmetsp:Transcript_8004/g.25690  ORF Transcript_8004/g.25690 Transcript_8004/m.25690 type:complete len:93 (+) Transcript_8004:76-354(+)